MDGQAAIIEYTFKTTPRTDALPFFEYPNLVTPAAMALAAVLAAVRRCYACRYHA